jgi:alkanesulfonate monooxygenase SsuD/methylene tetrahydromethanopterin reductase-like flavin-dependent oxidoreductase (luciferase family)
VSDQPFAAIGMYFEHPGVGLREALEFAARAEASGIAISAVGEGWEDNFAMVGALAACTTRVEIVSAIATWTRTPVATALAATTSAELSGGRYRLGLGAIPRRWSEDWHGIPYNDPVARMRDYVGAVRAAWRSGPGKPVDYSGSHYAFSGYERPSPVLPEPIPLYLGASRERMTELSGEVADGVVFSSILTASWLRDVSWPALERGFAVAGRAREGFEVGSVIFCAIDEETSRARDLMRGCVAMHAARFPDITVRSGFEAELERIAPAVECGDHAAAAEAVTDAMVEEMAVVGTADEVRAKLGRYEGLIDWPILMPPIGLDPTVSRGQIERIIETFGND